MALQLGSVASLTTARAVAGGKRLEPATALGRWSPELANVLAELPTQWRSTLPTVWSSPT